MMREFRTIVFAYAMFAMIILATLAWAMFKEYRYGGNPNEIENVADTIVVYKDIRFASHKEWEDFTKAIIWVESKGKWDAIGKNDDVGVLQITPILVEDCNRIVGYDRFDLYDRLDSLKSVEMFNVIQGHYNPQRDYHWALKLWNSGAPLSYHRKVMDKFNEIKESSL